MSHNAARASPRSGSISCFCALCSRPRLLPFLFTAASSSFSNPIIRSGEDCRHFNFNSYSGIASDPSANNYTSVQLRQSMGDIGWVTLPTGQGPRPYAP